jgi:hypothetical protein
MALICILADIDAYLDGFSQREDRVNASPVIAYSKTADDLGLYLRLNDRLDQAVVPYTVNEASLVTLREALCRDGNPASACYWLVLARLAELALLCAGHYAQCGEIGAAGDLLLNPRRIEIHVRGAHQPIVKDRHRRLSEQFNAGGVSVSEFTTWFQLNAITRVVEPALIPDLYNRLEQGGWLSEVFLDALQDRMTQVADAMRFGPAAIGAGVPAGRYAHRSGRSSADTDRQAHQCRLEATDYRRLGRDVAQRCNDATYRSCYLADQGIRARATVSAIEEGQPCAPDQIIL